MMLGWQVFRSAVLFAVVGAGFGALPAFAEGTTLQPAQRIDVPQWCEKIRTAIREFHWSIDPCQDVNWKIGGWSVNGYPLVYGEFGPEDAKNTTLVFTMVHGDEITPLFIGIELTRWMRENLKNFPSTRVVIAPLVNPDSFFRRPRTRVNARGVDVNRNFSTRDWSTRALQAWKTKFRSNPRRFPGSSPDSEPETVFQKELIARIRPQKILSVHAPLNFLDYDGPSTMSLARFPRDYVQQCVKLRSRLRAISGGFYPGSLGNYAGQEMGIPTITLELPTADYKKAELYWKKFSTGIRTMIEFKVPGYAARLTPRNDG